MGRSGSAHERRHEAAAVAGPALPPGRHVGRDRGQLRTLQRARHRVDLCLFDDPESGVVRERFELVFGDCELGGAILRLERGDVSSVRDALRRAIADRYGGYSA